MPSLAAVATPGPGGCGRKEEEVDRALTEVEAGWFRGASARANYLAQDRFDLAFAAKELCRRMAVPRRSDLVALRRLARYVIEVPRLVQCFRWQAPIREFVVYTDTDFAGCPRTRRSTNGGAIMRGRHGWCSASGGRSRPASSWSTLTRTLRAVPRPRSAPPGRAGRHRTWCRRGPG